LKSEDQNHKNNGKNLKIQISRKFKKNAMEVLSVIAQLIVAVCSCCMGICFDNIVKEFKQYELSDLTRMIVGAKIASATLLIVGIWYPSLLIPALVMAFLMLSAQYFHFKVNNPG
jgi:hypothetical protein